MADPTVISIGNFDGVHLGHRAIIARARTLADQHAARLVAITFEPLPHQVLRPQAAPPRLLPLDERVRQLHLAGADHVAVLEPTPEFLGQSAMHFVQWLVEQYAPRALVEGPDFRFGKGRAGDNALLTVLGGQFGFRMVVVEPLPVVLEDHRLAPVSSTLVRWLVAMGRISDAGRCLGRAYELAGVVTRGAQRGRTISVPTANLEPASMRDRMIPADGVYAGTAVLPDGRRHAAAISIGFKPTFQGTRRLVEAHLLDFAGDLYDRTLRVQLLRWVRDQQPFPSPDALAAQLRRDLALVRQWQAAGLLDGPPASAADMGSAA